MKYLGIDFGSKRVGVAVSDNAGTMAFPKKVLINSGPKNLIKELVELCATENINEIVMGDSRDYHGRPNEIMKEIESFSILLQEEIKLPLHFQLEFMSSAHAAQPSMGLKMRGDAREKKEGLKGNNALIDASAAAIILQSFLDKIKA